MNYKDTLNLPSTKFPMKANLPQREPDILKLWDKINLYKKIRDKHAKSDNYILHDGPPYANGDIHIGHAVNKVLKDIVTKSKTFSGFNAPLIPGWDCHGLPIELMVEKKYGKSKFKDNKNAFRKACREYASKQINKQKIDFIRLGVVADWVNPYTSMDKDFEASVVKSFSDILKNNHIYHGSKPVHWCIESESALAEAEVEYKDLVSDAVDILFKISDQNKFKKVFSLEDLQGDIFCCIWTTTPWTLPANQAIAIGDNIDYVLVKIKSKYVIIAEDLVDSFFAKDPDEIVPKDFIKKFKGNSLVGFQSEHPFYNKVVPIITAEHVTTENGTGLVHIAPGHGQDDYIAGLKNNLEVFNPVNDKGLFIESLELFGGLHVRKANDPIIKCLIDNDKILHHEKYNHSYPHCWRFKTPLIFRATPQWFVSMDQGSLREKINNNLDKVNWVPSWGYDRIKNMIKNRPDWCISRQRFWGVPIPLFVNKETNELHTDTSKILDKVADIISRENIEGWFDYDKSKLVDNPDEYYMVTDTLDVWFDSGVSHIAVMKQRGLGDTADLYLEGSDQHRGWFQSSLITGMAIMDKPPYKNVLTHGFVVDANGQKMSKSQGNVIAPQSIIKSKGSDILRLWVATTDYTKEMHISEEILKRASEGYRRIRNTIKFLLSNISDYSNENSKTPDELTLVDKWILNQAQILQISVRKNYDEFKFHQIVQDIQNFCTVQLGGYYLDIIKDRLYTSKVDGGPRRASQYVCYNILKMMNIWIAPILSFTAEEVYQQMDDRKFDSVFLDEWVNDEFSIDDNENKVGNKLFALKQLVSKKLDEARNNDIIGSSLEATIHLNVDNKTYDLLSSYKDELKFIFITSDCNLNSEFENNEIEILVEKNNNLKCERCWHMSDTVGKVEKHPLLCSRCHSNVYADGEQRKLG
jgi:isoleucyl-tRNA synthetase